MHDDAILAALKTVIDPELGINVVDLGLVCRAERAGNAIDVALAMTSPACPLGESITEEARLALKQCFPDASSIHVELVRDFVWSPERMSEDGRRQLGLG